MSSADEQPLPRSGRLAGIDYGTVRVGVAICDPGQTLASPLEIYQRRSLAADTQYFVRLAKDEQLVGFVVGLPLHMSGDESQKSLEARRYGAWLQSITRLPVTLFDERHTSTDAESLLLTAGLTSKQRKARLDMLAAQLILSAFLHHRAATTPFSSQGTAPPIAESQPKLES